MEEPTTGRRRMPAAAGATFHTAKSWPITPFSRIFLPINLLAILALFYHHLTNLYLSLIPSPTTSSPPPPFFATLAMLLADIVLAFMWSTVQALRMNPIRRREMVEDFEEEVVVGGRSNELLGLDVFICTADPYKEPPIRAVNTALSVMAYEYPRDKLSVYVSDDGGSAVTLFSLMEAAKFAGRWLPFCDKNKVVERNPGVYFEAGHHPASDISAEEENIKSMYERMKVKVEEVLEKGRVDDQYINGAQEKDAFNKWTTDPLFTKHNHPTLIQVLLESNKDKDTDGHLMPNLIYVSRQKSKTSPHHFKAGALNVLLRVSATMTNAPIVLTLDCDMYSNDPKTPIRAMCYFCDPKLGPENSAYLQFPQCYHGINKNDIYAGEFQRLFRIQAMGFDGLRGPNHVGTGCFFRRRVFFGGPSSPVPPEIPEVGHEYVPVNESIRSESVLELADKVAGCTYENKTDWGYKIGYRYGSLVEDMFTGYSLHCEGWRSIFCCPDRSAFIGDAPISLVDMLTQQKRWAIGVLEATEPWFWVYPFLFLAGNIQDLADFLYVGGTISKWWSDQRIWLLRGLTCHLFGTTEYFLKFLGISADFNVTSKVIDEEQSKRYDQGIFEFGVHNPMFVPPTVAALINLLALLQGLTGVIIRGGGIAEAGVLEVCLAGFAVVNCWPIYEAVALRSDDGRMPVKTTVLSIDKPVIGTPITDYLLDENSSECQPTMAGQVAEESEKGSVELLELQQRDREPANHRSDDKRRRRYPSEMDPKLTEVSQYFERFKAACVRGDIESSANLLSQLKVLLTSFRSLPPLFENTPNAVQELTIASNDSFSWNSLS
ncbi:Cellulose synthase-like protein G3 [Linum grandiflorum]